MKVWLNGTVLELQDATIGILDRGFLYGDGVFESMRSYRGYIFKLREHLERLYFGLKVLKISVPYEMKVFEEAIYTLLKINRLSNAYIRVTVTRGVGKRRFLPHRDLKPNTVIITERFKTYPSKIYNDGVRLKISGIRQNESSPITRIKSINYLNNILAKVEARQAGFDDALMLNLKGCVAEASASNIFLVKDNRLITPSVDSGILPGITRAVILDIAKKLGLETIQQKIYLSEVYTADEVFLTNSLIEVVPVIEVDQKLINNGIIGKWTRKLHLAYRSFIRP